MQDEDATTTFEVNVTGMDPLEQTCRRIEAVINEGGWDAKPHFYTLSVLLGDDIPADVRNKVRQAGPEYDGALALAELTMPEFCYDNPAEGLPLFLQLTLDLAVVKEHDIDPQDMMKMLDRMVPQGFYGFGLVFEGWTLPASVPEEEAKQYSRDHTINEHPDRIEMRSVIMVTRNGREVTLVRKRGQFPVYQEIDSDVCRLAGRVPDAIRKLALMFEKFDDFRNGRLDTSRLN